MLSLFFLLMLSSIPIRKEKDEGNELLFCEVMIHGSLLFLPFFFSVEYVPNIVFGFRLLVTDLKKVQGTSFSPLPGSPGPPCS